MSRRYPMLAVALVAIAWSLASCSQNADSVGQDDDSSTDTDSDTDSDSDSDSDTDSDTGNTVVTAEDFEVTVDQCMVARVDLDELVTVIEPDGPVEYSVVSNSGDGQAKIVDGTELRYCSAIEPGPVEVLYQAQCGFAIDTATVTVNLENNFTVADAKAAIEAEFPALLDSFDAWEQFAMYNGSYTNLALRNAFVATCDQDYWDMFKDYFAVMQSKATQTYYPIADGEFFHEDNIASAMFPALTSTTTSITIAGDHTSEFIVGRPILVYLTNGDLDWSTTATSVTLDGPNTDITWSASSSITSAPGFVAVRNLFAGPEAAAGTQYATYLNFEPYGDVNGQPNIKAQTQWSMTALHLIHDVIKGACDLPEAEVDWAIDAYDFVHRNVLEFVATERNAGWAGSRLWRMMMHARDETISDPQGQSGYFGSNIGTAYSCYLLEEAIRIELDRPQYAYMEVIEDFKNTESDPIWDTIDGDPHQWYRWWHDQVYVLPDGSGIWDCGDEPDDPAYNEWINTTGGWGYPGEHKCPGTSHASRYIYAAQIALDTELETDTSVMTALGKTTGTTTCLPLDYVWQEGDHAGLSSGTQRAANYIDGDNSCFRCPESGWYSPSGSNEDMEGFIYQGWYLGALFDDDAKDCVTRIFNQVRGPYISESSVEHTGTYMRHRSGFGKIMLWSDMLDIEHRRAQLISF
jgi:hypothetical protein